MLELSAADERAVRHEPKCVQEVRMDWYGVLKDFAAPSVAFIGVI
jgi:hypothetical protein